MKCLDCLIIGGGPAGLVAATYLGRFHRSVLVVDAGESRANLIPESHNYPGFMGISGKELLQKLRNQAKTYGAELVAGTVSALSQEEFGFAATVRGKILEACTVLLCTGLEDKKPAIEIADSSGATRIRYCPVCDAYEGTDRRLGVIGDSASALRKALFLRTYTEEVFYFGRIDNLPADLRQEAWECGIESWPHPTRITATATAVELVTIGGTICIDALYPALGCKVRSDLATTLGGHTAAEGTLVVDHCQKTNIEKLYAAGDVVSDLHQLTVAAGHAAVAATAIHKLLPRNSRRAFVRSRLFEEA